MASGLSPSLMEEYFREYPRNVVINIRKDIHWNCSWKIEDIPGNIPRNICNNFLKNNTFNHDSFALENKAMITKYIPSNIPRNIPRNIRNNYLKNNTFNCDSFALENKTMIHMGKHSLNSRRISIKLLECVQKIFLIFSQPFFEGYPSKKKKKDIPRNILLYLVLMKWNYYKCRLDILQVSKHH